MRSLKNDEILSLKDRIVEQLSPLKVNLFGSFAEGTSKEDSDYDFYVVVEDNKTDWYDQTLQAYKAIRPQMHMKTVIVTFSSRSGGNCSQIGNLIRFCQKFHKLTAAISGSSVCNSVSGHEAADHETKNDGG